MSYLVHWGIKGQKWGHRRYQNEDGSLTSAGSSRYIDDPGDRFRLGQHVGESSSKMNAVAKVATTVGRAANSVKRADTKAQNKSRVYRVARQTGAVDAVASRLRQKNRKEKKLPVKKQKGKRCHLSRKKL